MDAGAQDFLGLAAFGGVLERLDKIRLHWVTRLAAPQSR
jgi:hypothetical protein